MIVTVRDRSVDFANKVLKNKMQKAGIFQKLQESKHFISPSQLRKEKKNNKMKAIAKYKRNQMKTESKNKKAK